MARRTVFTFFLTAIVFLFLGATGVYLAMSIPNDIHAETILIQARSDLKAGKRDEARAKFENVVKTYPRTDAAAAAAYALFRLLDQDRKELAEQLERVEGERNTLRKAMGELDRRVADASQKAEQAAKPPPPPPRKTPPRRTTSTRRRRG